MLHNPAQSSVGRTQPRRVSSAAPTTRTTRTTATTQRRNKQASPDPVAPPAIAIPQLDHHQQQQQQEEEEFFYDQQNHHQNYQQQEEEEEEEGKEEIIDETLIPSSAYARFAKEREKHRKELNARPCHWSTSGLKQRCSSASTSTTRKRSNSNPASVSPQIKGRQSHREEEIEKEQKHHLKRANSNVVGARPSSLALAADPAATAQELRALQGNRNAANAVTPEFITNTAPVRNRQKVASSFYLTTDRMSYLPAPIQTNVKRITGKIQREQIEGIIGMHWPISHSGDAATSSLVSHPSSASCSSSSSSSSSSSTSKGAKSNKKQQHEKGKEPSMSAIRKRRLEEAELQQKKKGNSLYSTPQRRVKGVQNFVSSPPSSSSASSSPLLCSPTSTTAGKDMFSVPHTESTSGGSPNTLTTFDDSRHTSQTTNNSSSSRSGTAGDRSQSTWSSSTAPPPTQQQQQNQQRHSSSSSHVARQYQTETATIIHTQPAHPSLAAAAASRSAQIAALKFLSPTRKELLHSMQSAVWREKQLQSNSNNNNNNNNSNDQLQQNSTTIAESSDMNLDDLLSCPTEAVFSNAEFQNQTSVTAASFSNSVNNNNNNNNVETGSELSASTSHATSSVSFHHNHHSHHNMSPSARKSKLKEYLSRTLASRYVENFKDLLSTTGVAEDRWFAIDSSRQWRDSLLREWGCCALMRKLVLDDYDVLEDYAMHG